MLPATCSLRNRVAERGPCHAHTNSGRRPEFQDAYYGSTRAGGARPHAGEEREAGLGEALGNAHWHYTGRINAREGWQGRFASYVMDEPYLLAAVRYIELNPVRAGLVKHPAEYRWSSARSRISGQPDLLARPERLNDILAMYPACELCEEDIEKIQKHSSTGRPLGGEEFMAGLESKLGRSLAKGRPGPRPKNHEISCVSP